MEAESTGENCQRHLKAEAYNRRGAQLVEETRRSRPEALVPSSPHITRLLRAWSDGDEGAFEALVPIVYGELRRLARVFMRRERRGVTLQPTALVNEA